MPRPSQLLSSFFGGFWSLQIRERISQKTGHEPAHNQLIRFLDKYKADCNLQSQLCALPTNGFRCRLAAGKDYPVFLFDTGGELGNLAPHVRSIFLAAIPLPWADAKKRRPHGWRLGGWTRLHGEPRYPAVRPANASAMVALPFLLCTCRRFNASPAVFAFRVRGARELRAN